MKVYLDACCLNRPFDDQGQDRIRMESEAILIILNHLHAHDWEWIGSEALEAEIRRPPNIDKRNRVMLLASSVHRLIRIEQKEIERAKDLVNVGFNSFDALHVACAESGGVDIFLTTDDKLLKLATKMSEKINIVVSNPISWIMEVM